LRDVEAPHFINNWLKDGGEFEALRAGRLLPPGSFLVLISVRGRVDPRAIVRLEENPMTSGTEPATLRLVALCRNTICYCVPPLKDAVVALLYVLFQNLLG
jgi:hypothetical protein